MAIDNRNKAIDKVSDINDELTISNGVKIIARQSKDSYKSVMSSADTFSKANRKVLGNKRQETFEEAQGRIGVVQNDLPLINNQIALQAYVCLFVSVICFLMSIRFLMINSDTSSAMMSGLIGTLGLVFFTQSSIHSYQIREKKLGLFQQWIFSPQVWLPKRMGGLKKMDSTDPLRKPEVINSLVKKARFYFYGFLGFIGISIGLFFAVENTIETPWWTPFVLFAVVFFISGSRNSFEVYKRREAIHSDVGLWIISPWEWIPKVSDKRTDSYVSLAEKMKSRKASRSENVDEAALIDEAS